MIALVTIGRCGFIQAALSNRLTRATFFLRFRFDARQGSGAYLIYRFVMRTLLVGEIQIARSNLPAPASFIPGY